MHVVIIGNGVAGMEAALTVRAEAPDARITLVSEESDHFFSRTALMWVHSGQLSHRDIEPLEREAYVRHRFTRVRACQMRPSSSSRSMRTTGKKSFWS